jgi:hypothetical protein
MRLLHNVIFEQTKVWLTMNVLLCLFYAFAAAFLESRPEGKALSSICSATAAAMAVYQIGALMRKRTEEQ